MILLQDDKVSALLVHLHLDGGVASVDLLEGELVAQSVDFDDAELVVSQGNHAALRAPLRGKSAHVIKRVIAERHHPVLADLLIAQVRATRHGKHSFSSLRNRYF